MLQKTIDLAREEGNQYGVKVVPVSLTEAHILASHKSPAPFPFLTLVSTMDMTQLVLSYGIGNHNIMGFQLDTSMSKCFKAFTKEI